MTQGQAALRLPLGLPEGWISVLWEDWVYPALKQELTENAQDPVGEGALITSMATAMSGEHSSQTRRSWSTFRRTCGRILRSRFSPNFCSFVRIFLAGRKLFRSSGSLDNRSKYLRPKRRGSVG